MKRKGDEAEDHDHGYLHYAKEYGLDTGWGSGDPIAYFFQVIRKQQRAITWKIHRG